MRAKFRDNKTGRLIFVHSEKNEFGKDVWVSGNVTYGQCQFGAPFGYTLEPAGQGGVARNQGRKKMNPLIKKQLRSIGLPKWVWQEIDRMQGNAHKVLLDAVTKHHNMTIPNEAQS